MCPEDAYESFLVDLLDALSLGLTGIDLLLGGPTGEGILPALALQALKAELKKGALNPKQLANLARFEKALPKGAKEAQIRDLPSGGKALQAEVPGKVPGSKAVYEKQIDASGNTINYTKTTYAPDGSIVHVKSKFP